MRIKCAGCGFINFSQDQVCKRCKSSLEYALEYANIWRDGNKLVAGADAVLPQRCLKCTTPVKVSRFPISLTYTPFATYCTAYFLRFAYWENYSIHGFLCVEHRNAAMPKTFLLLPNVLIVMGVLSALIALIGVDFKLSVVMFLMGAGMFVIGLLMRSPASKTFRVSKRNKTHIWIGGVDPDLLAELEDFKAPKGQCSAAHLPKQRGVRLGVFSREQKNYR